MKILILITVVAMATVGNAGYSCPEFWNLFGGNCYRYRGDRLTWSAAEARCNEDSTIAGMGHLASIHSLAENRFVYEMFKSSVSINDIPDWVYSVADRNPLYGIWTGLHQAVADGPWKNSDGTDQGDFFKWMRAEEPNNDYYGGEEVEDCVHIFRYNDASDIQQGWNDIYCNEVMSFVCKMPADMESCE
ncbi:echinoidin-like [Strongylocentrotus purpuratus]|uniref:C-type lectin domain-containing protein n=1 Tax=Strongylocentrotus purpuratus TaxID=7668 RepID=A0A7M7PA46_STRPU|nr:echinoidin-like [Strongylocentrotus purpuratus]